MIMIQIICWYCGIVYYREENGGICGELDIRFDIPFKVIDVDQEQ